MDRLIPKFLPSRFLLPSLFLPQRCANCCAKSEELLCPLCSPPPLSNISRCDQCWSENPTLLPESPICVGCKFQPLPIRHIRYLWEYRDQTKSAISIMKYRPSLGLCQSFSQAVRLESKKMFAPLTCWDAIVPVPSSSASLRSRGFHQTLVLAKGLKDCGYIDTDLVQRQRYRFFKELAPQASLTLKERRKNVRKAYKIKCHPRKHYRSILLIDDVLTTGSTAMAMALLLRRHFDVSVDLLTLACSPSWSEQRIVTLREVMLGLK